MVIFADRAPDEQANFEKVVLKNTAKSKFLEILMLSWS